MTHDDIIHRLIDRIDAAAIPAPAYRTAMRLLRYTHPEAAYARISYAEMAEIAGGNFNTARGHLAALARADLITCRQNGAVHVMWHIDGTVIDDSPRAGRAESAPNRAVARDQRADDETADLTKNDIPRDQRAKSAPNRAVARDQRALPHTRDIGWMDGSTNTDAEVHPSIPAPDLEPNTAGRALLADIRVRPDAQLLADKYTFAVIRECVAAWWMNRKSVGGKLQNDAGIVVHWLRDCGGVPPNGYDVDAWRRTDLYRRHRTTAEIAADDQAAADEAAHMEMLATRPPPEPPPPSPYLDDDLAWQHLAQPGTNYHGMLAGLVRIDDAGGTPVYVLAAMQATHVEWLEARLIKQLQRAIQADIGRPALVEIVPPVVAGELEDGNT